MPATTVYIIKEGNCRLRVGGQDQNSTANDAEHAESPFWAGSGIESAAAKRQDHRRAKGGTRMVEMASMGPGDVLADFTATGEGGVVVYSCEVVALGDVLLYEMPRETFEVTRCTILRHHALHACPEKHSR